MKRTLLIQSIIVSFLLSSASLASAATNGLMDDHLYDYVDLLASTNHYSPLEGGGSHGSIGVGLGLGASVHSMPEHTKVIDDQLRTSDEFAANTPGKIGSQITVPRVFFHKGLPWPVDFGVSVGQITGLSALTAGGYAQWTVFEALAMPAVAIRGKHSRMMGLPSTEFQTSSLEAAVSYGFLRIVTAYGTYAFNRHEATIETSGERGTTLALNDDKSTVVLQKSDQSRALGLQIQLIPQICTVTAESRDNGGQSTYLAKLSIGL